MHVRSYRNVIANFEIATLRPDLDHNARRLVTGDDALAAGWRTLLPSSKVLAADPAGPGFHDKPVVRHVRLRNLPHFQSFR